MRPNNYPKNADDQCVRKEIGLSVYDEYHFIAFVLKSHFLFFNYGEGYGAAVTIT